MISYLWRKWIGNHYLKNHLGYPGRDGARNNEEWEAIINQMIEYIDIMLEDEDDDRREGLRQRTGSLNFTANGSLTCGIEV